MRRGGDEEEDKDEAVPGQAAVSVWAVAGILVGKGLWWCTVVGNGQ